MYVRKVLCGALLALLVVSIAVAQVVPPNVSRDDGGDFTEKLVALLGYLRARAIAIYADPTASGQVLVSDSTAAATWKTLPNCPGGTGFLNYTATTNTWSCGASGTTYFPAGIVCNGIADDTAAIQAALTALAAATGRIDLPAGTCNISSTLLYTGQAGTSLTFGGVMKPSRGLQGTLLKWVGATGGTILETRGANNSRIHDLAFTGNFLAKYGIFVRTNEPAGGSGSSGVELSDLVLVGMTGAHSAAIRIGDSTQQASEVWLNRVVMAGNGANTEYGIVFGTANAKNYSMTNVAISGFQYGVVQSAGADGIAGSAGGSGYLAMHSMTFGGNTLADIWHGNGGELSLNGWDSELSTRFLVGVGGSGPSSNTISNGSWTGITPVDDFVIDVSGASLILTNNYFYNARSVVAPFSAPKIRSFSNIASPGSPFRIVATGNTYLNWKGVYAPLYVGTTPMEVAVASGQFAVESTMEHAFPLDASSYHLKPFSGLIPSQSGLALQPYPGPALETGLMLVSSGESRQTILVIDIAKETWVAAATVQGVKWTTPKNIIIRDIICDTTEAYAGAGLTGTILLGVGVNANASAYITGHDVKTAPVVKGGLEADRGVRLTQAGVNGGRYYVPAAELLGIFLISSVGNVGNGTVTNLTAGHTRCTISYEMLPL